MNALKLLIGISVCSIVVFMLVGAWSLVTHYEGLNDEKKTYEDVSENMTQKDERENDVNITFGKAEFTGCWNGSNTWLVEMRAEENIWEVQVRGFNFSEERAEYLGNGIIVIEMPKVDGQYIYEAKIVVGYKRTENHTAIFNIRCEEA
ncbi:hypothetical protein [Sulfuricurvum sp.]|uniref:hypothetical protein n=1 Tax=Sulfuricurvum sp. TaxID=2025608 RepID=UPI0035694459